MLTSSWFTRLPDDHIKIGVSRGTPRGVISAPNIRSLNPGPWFKTADTETYRSLYVGQLAKLNPMQVVAAIDKAAGGKIPVLCCYERAGGPDWCHRGYISAWLLHHLGLIIPEFGMEHVGFGGSHPMLPAEYRAPQAHH